MITMKDIIREGHPTLRKRAEKVSFPLDAEEAALTEEMMVFLKNSQDEKIAAQYELRAGVGLAAPQLNISKQIIAVHIPNLEYEDGEPELSGVFINPRIISHSVEDICLKDGEGCLSVDREVPGYVPRHARITLSYQDTTGEQFKKRFSGYPAIVLQHEIDHLNGIMFYDLINEENPFKLTENTSILDEDETE